MFPPGEREQQVEEAHPKRGEVISRVGAPLKEEEQQEEEALSNKKVRQCPL